MCDHKAAAHTRLVDLPAHQTPMRMACREQMSHIVERMNMQDGAIQPQRSAPSVSNTNHHTPISVIAHHCNMTRSAYKPHACAQHKLRFNVYIDKFNFAKLHTLCDSISRSPMRNIRSIGRHCVSRFHVITRQELSRRHSHVTNTNACAMGSCTWLAQIHYSKCP